MSLEKLAFGGWGVIVFKMKWNFFQLKSHRLLLGALLLLPPSAHSYPVSSFDARALTERASVVCKVKVLSVEQAGAYTDESFHPPLNTIRMVGHVKCLATVKGSPSVNFSIAYPESASMVAYTGLATGEVCIVFLEETNGTPRFVDVHNGKMPCSTAVVPYDKGGKPQDRLLCELLALCNSSTGTTQLLGTEYLGQLKDARARTILETASKSGGQAMRGVALTSLIKIGVGAPAKEILSYLDQDPSNFDYGASLSKYGTSAYTISTLAGGIMRAIEGSIQVKGGDDDMVTARPTRQLPDFDYVAFLDKAMTTRLVQVEPLMRRSVAGALRQLADKRSVPQLKRLLDDVDVEVRYYAVTALTGIYKAGPFPSFPLFKTNETAYVGYWKDRLKQ
ncbi:MAG: hypothetical protein ABSC18_08580 [Verrucomicrobiota bacterium]